MNHKVVPRPCKICDWLLNLSRDHYNLHQGGTMEFEVSKRHILRLTLSLTWSNGFCGGRGKRGAVMEKDKGAWHTNELQIIKQRNNFWGKRRWRQEKTGEWSNLDVFKTALFKSTHSLLVHDHSSGPTLGLHLVRGSKACGLIVLRNRTMDVGSWRMTMVKGHLPWSDFMVHGVGSGYAIPKLYGHDLIPKNVLQSNLKW